MVGDIHAQARIGLKTASGSLGAAPNGAPLQGFSTGFIITVAHRTGDNRFKIGIIVIIALLDISPPHAIKEVYATPLSTSQLSSLCAESPSVLPLTTVCPFADRRNTPKHHPRKAFAPHGHPRLLLRTFAAIPSQGDPRHPHPHHAGVQQWRGRIPEQRQQQRWKQRGRQGVASVRERQS